ncbi:hypothetical protein [Conexibacter sp. SYSU D00693]|uniref:hypothetical protein n=1 Tax=Conexibacter sp. SYSU D00693 TaxID=2812560 RepID=UPI00196A3450|nr:hypothetical protein [Conexibacter sp. SYSU D00693]
MRATTLAAAAGLAASALFAALLAAAGAGHLDGPPAGVLALPLLGLAVAPAVREAVRRDDGRLLLVLGAAWTIAPLLDQHLVGAVAVDGTLPHLLLHTAGWAPLLAGSQRLTHPRPVVIR